MSSQLAEDSLGPVWMDARIRPNIALTGTGTATFSMMIGLPSVFIAFILALKGALLPSLFVTATAGLLIIAMLHNASELLAYEERIVLTDTALVVETCSRRGQQPMRRSISPNWIRLERKNQDESGCGSLVLWSREKSYVIASVLSPPERSAFADALEAALRLRSGRPA